MASKVKRALHGIRILELGNFTAGPFCQRILANLGAEIIKIEPPKGGPDRKLPPFLKDGSSYFYHFQNCDKKNLTLDIGREKGKEILKKLITLVDIVVENFSKGVMSRLGFSHEVLKEINPDLIYCSVKGFGEEGPYQHKRGYDAVIQAMGGIMSITGQPTGPPTKVGFSLADQLGANVAAIPVLAALHYRNRTGKGQFIDISMQDLAGWITQSSWSQYFVSGEKPQRYGNRHPGIAPHNAYQAKDGWVVIAIETEENWFSLLKGIGREGLINDDRFNSPAKRVAQVEEVDQLINQWTMSKTVIEIVRLLGSVKVPSGPVLGLDEVVAHPHTIKREMIVELEHPKIGRFKVTGCPLKMSETPGIVNNPGPDLGQHNEEILCNLLGFSKEEVRKLRDEKVI
jgi:crotonobetainyl-CoA:carnitine CoA-transferase CaiB-like acyl-CoA transferase